MGTISQYERLQIGSLLSSGGAQIEPGAGLFLMPEDPAFRRVLEVAVAPAMRKNELNLGVIEIVFDSGSSLREVCQRVLSAEVIVADVSTVNADLMYALGLCHGLGRCPILLVAEPANLPFNLAALRCVEYVKSDEGLRALRQQLTRAIRVFLAASRAGGKPER